MQDTLLLLTPERAAERLDIGRTRLYELLASGELESVKVGRSRRIPAAALVEFVARLRAGTSHGEDVTAREATG
jgi:excisionase family DNA binding protein